MITCFFGLPGCGKSTMLAKIAAKELQLIEKGKSKYKRIYCNYYIKGCYKLNFLQLGMYDTSDSLILLDEITLDADSRDFKKFAQASKQFFILHRKYGCDVIYVTQQYDAVDRKIRELTYDLYYMKRLGPLTYATKIHRAISFPEGDIKLGYRLSSLMEVITNPKINLRLCWRSRWYKYFDTAECPKLPEWDGWQKYE